MTLRRLAYKYRIRSNGQQTRLLARTFGCCRFLYNQYVEWNNAALNLRAWYYTHLAVAALPLERREVTPLESSPLPVSLDACGQAFTLKEETQPSCEPSEGSPREAKWG